MRQFENILLGIMAMKIMCIWNIPIQVSWYTEKFT